MPPQILDSPGRPKCVAACRHKVLAAGGQNLRQHAAANFSPAGRQNLRQHAAAIFCPRSTKICGSMAPHFLARVLGLGLRLDLPVHAATNFGTSWGVIGIPRTPGMSTQILAGGKPDNQGRAMKTTSGHISRLPNNAVIYAHLMIVCMIPNASE